jgi:hypothetical protein
MPGDPSYPQCDGDVSTNPESAYFTSAVNDGSKYPSMIADGLNMNFQVSGGENPDSGTVADLWIFWILLSSPVTFCPYLTPRAFRLSSL